MRPRKLEIRPSKQKKRQLLGLNKLLKPKRHRQQEERRKQKVLHRPQKAVTKSPMLLQKKEKRSLMRNQRKQLSLLMLSQMQQNHLKVIRSLMLLSLTLLNLTLLSQMHPSLMQRSHLAMHLNHLETHQSLRHQKMLQSHPASEHLLLFAMVVNNESILN